MYVKATLQVGGHGERLNQCREVTLTTTKPLPVQVRTVHTPVTVLELVYSSTVFNIRTVPAASHTVYTIIYTKQLLLINAAPEAGYSFVQQGIQLFVTD